MTWASVGELVEHLRYRIEESCGVRVRVFRRGVAPRDTSSSRPLCGPASRPLAGGETSGESRRMWRGAGVGTSPSWGVGAVRVVLIVVAVWAIVASTLALIMARRGHDPFVWWLLGAVLGPLAVPLAVAHRFRSASPLVAPEPGMSGRVLVALRPGGDAGDVTQALSALAAVGGPVGVTLATALDADALGSQGGREAIDVAARGLGDVAEALVARGLVVPPVPTRVLFGDPAVVLAEHAVDCGYSLLVVGAASRRSHRIAHGSTRVRLSRRGNIPVLLAPTEGDLGAPTKIVSST